MDSMDTTTDKPQDELGRLHRNLQKGLDDMLAFNNNISRFNNRTLKLYLTLTSDHTKFRETLKRLEELENKLSQRDIHMVLLQEE